MIHGKTNRVRSSYLQGQAQKSDDVVQQVKSCYINTVSSIGASMCVCVGGGGGRGCVGYLLGLGASYATKYLKTYSQYMSIEPGEGGGGSVLQYIPHNASVLPDITLTGLLVNLLEDNTSLSVYVTKEESNMNTARPHRTRFFWEVSSFFDIN